MEPIYRGNGLTKSERYLARLADRTFLDLWSYPNPYIDKRTGPKSTGKELCDLLVVCGDDVIVFSDKAIEWQKTEELDIAWPRWYRRAVAKSVDQISGAVRWILDFPQRVFLDPACEKKLPLSLPGRERIRIHAVAVAIGARAACSAHFPGSSGTLMLVPKVKGKSHADPKIENYFPFAIGDVNPAGIFVHVFDDQGLDLVMRELDTVSDFTDYLTRRERIIRSGHLLTAPGEEDLLAYYLHSFDGKNHDFVKPSGERWKGNESFGVEEGMYNDLVTRPEYIAKREEDRISYLWDTLIKEFTRHVLAGTSVAVFDRQPDAGEAEQGLRIMAQEPRVYRRMLGQALMGTINGLSETKKDRFCRIVMPNGDDRDRSLAYVFLAIPYPDHLSLAGGYDQYRKVRANMLHAYCFNVLESHRNLTRVVGIALDGKASKSGIGTSEDLLALEQLPEWTDEAVSRVKELQEQFDVMREWRVERSAFHTSEFPQPRPSGNLSRQQRRAAQRAAEKNAKRRVGG